MKRLILLIIIVLPLIAMIGCTAEKNDKEIKTETSYSSEVSLDLTGLNFYWHSGSMAGMDYNYSISKNPTGTYAFHAEIESENRIVDREISQEQFDTIIQMVKDNYVAETTDEDSTLENEYPALDADNFGFEITHSDGHTQSINLGQVKNEVLSKLNKLLEESST